MSITDSNPFPWAELAANGVGGAILGYSLGLPWDVTSVSALSSSVPLWGENKQILRITTQIAIAIFANISGLFIVTTRLLGPSGRTISMNHKKIAVFICFSVIMNHLIKKLFHIKVAKPNPNEEIKAY